MPDGGGGKRNACSVSSPSVTFGDTSPWRERIKETINPPWRGEGASVVGGGKLPRVSHPRSKLARTLARCSSSTSVAPSAIPLHPSPMANGPPPRTGEDCALRAHFSAPRRIGVLLAPLPSREGERIRAILAPASSDQRFRRAHIFRATTQATTRTTTPRIKTPATDPATRNIPQNNASTKRPTATDRPIMLEGPNAPLRRP